MRIGSLCSGYGGLDLAVLEVLGGTVAWHADTDPAAARVLAAHWPGVPNYGDITATDWTVAEPVDVVTCGYPCQPDSVAGKGGGHADERWIWPAVRDAIRDLGSGLIVLENPTGHVGRGFRGVLGDLAEIGYDARWCCLPASAVGAVHGRERLFALATPADTDGPGRPALTVGSPPAGRQAWDDAGRSCDAPAADANGTGLEVGRLEPVGPERPAAERGNRGSVRWERWGKYAPAVARWERLTRLVPEPVETGPRGGQRLNARFSEWMMGLPAGWVTGVPGLSRADQLRLIGNGVVPRQAVAALRWLLA